MQQKFGFLKGLDRDNSPSKHDFNSYYDGLNIRVVTDDGLTTGSITNELGNELLFKIPSVVGTTYVITMNIPRDPTIIRIYTGEDEYLDASSWPSNPIWNNIEDVYNSILLNMDADIDAGKYKVSFDGNRITILQLKALDVFLVTTVSSGLAVNITHNLGVLNPIIIGMGTMRDWLVTFTADPADSGKGQIWKCKYNKVTELIDDIDVDTLTVDKHLVYTGDLNFHKEHRIGEVISRYQNNTHGKVYFVDGNNGLRHINILDPNSLSLPTNALDIIPDVKLNQPLITSVIKGGLYKSGKVQYVYQLYNLGGAETIFSPASYLTHLTISDDSNSNSEDYKGTVLDGDTGKAVVVTINNIDKTFEYIRLVALHYQTKEGEPIINVVSENPVPKSGSIILTDSGDTILDVYTVSEYNAYGSRLIIPKTIATKNNFLIAANIKEEYFDLDELLDEKEITFDARAYRWDNGVPVPGFKIDNTVEAFPQFIEEKQDCIFAEVDYQAGYKYNNITNNLGGSGLNVSYEFEVKTITIDNNVDTSTLQEPTTTQSWSSALDNTFADNVGYSGYASPINEQLVGFTRGETYRFGLVVFDKKGRQSFVKWVADIRMPDASDTDSKVTYVNSGVDKYDFNTVFYDSTYGSINANVLGIKFTVTGLEALGNEYFYKIVRTRREDKDKTILGQGLIGFTKDATGVIQPLTDLFYIGVKPNSIVGNIGVGDSFIGVSGYNHMITFKSPESLFNNSMNPLEGDTVDIIYDIPTTDILKAQTTQIVDWYDRVRIYKFQNLPLAGSDISLTVKDGIKVATDSLNKNIFYTISNDGAVTTFENVSYPSDPNIPTLRGSCLAVGLKGTSLTTLLQGNVSGVLIGNYKRDVALTRYGGSTYYEKLNNIYIGCGNSHDVTSTTSFVFGGDTYISYFDYLSNSYNKALIDKTADQQTLVVYIPLESTINCTLRNDTCYSRGGNTYKLVETTALGNELYPEGDSLGAYPASYTDLYLYNNVYSAEPTAKTFIPKPNYFVNNAENDYTIVISEKNINGQLTDSWTKFLFNNIIEVTSAYGSINKLITHNNQVFFFQDNAYGVVSVNDRQLLKDDSGAPLVLGTGGILDSFKYISEKAGSKSQFSVIDTGDFIFFYDLNNRKFMRYQGGQDSQVSDVKGMSSYFRKFPYGTALVSDATANGIGIHGVFDPISKRVLYTQLGDITETFSYNMYLDAFESFHSFVPNIYEDLDGEILSVNPSNSTEVYIHNKGSRGKYYGTYYPSYVTILANPQPDYKKVFTNLEFNSVVYASDGTEYFDDTIDLIKLWNSYQTTGDINLTTNIRRRFRTWRYQIPKVQGNRLLDYHSFIKLQFNNTVPGVDNKERILRLDDITISTLIPMI